MSKYCINVNADGTLAGVSFVNTKEEADIFVQQIKRKYQYSKTFSTYYLVWDEQNSEWVDCDCPFAK